MIDVTAVPRPVAPEPDAGVEVDVVYDDDHVIVVDKPAGLVVHPGAGHQAGTLVNALLARYGTLADVGELSRPGIVHRLDAGSSGLLVVARTEAAARGLVAQFAAHTAVRRYTAVVWGHPDAAHGVIDAPIGRSPSNPLRMAVVAGARPARTEYRVVTEYVEPTADRPARLPTGDRTHTPDPCPSRVDRSSTRRRRRVRRAATCARSRAAVPPCPGAGLRPSGR